MSGIIDTVGSKSGIIGSDVYPAGHVIGAETSMDESVSPHISFTANSTYEDTGISVSITAKASSTNSYFLYSFYSSMIQVDDHAEARLNCMMTTTNTTTFAVGELIVDTAYSTYIYPETNGDMYYPLYWRAYCGLEANMGMPATKSTWAAGDVLYFRLFGFCTTGTFKVCHQHGMWNTQVQEIAR